MPRWGATGGFVAIAVCALAGAAAALIGPSRLADLNPGEAIGGAPPLRGWIALVGTLIYVSGAGAVGVYLQPLAHAGGAGRRRRAHRALGLAGRPGGRQRRGDGAGRTGALVRRLHGHDERLPRRLVGDAACTSPAWLFIAANAAAGIFGLFLGPFLVPMTIEADPSRRAAVQSGAAQLIGGAMGPLLASRVVGDRQRAWRAVAGRADCMLAGLAVVAWLHVTSRRAPAAQTA